MAVLHPRMPHQLEIHAQLFQTPEGAFIMVRYGEQEWKLDVKENKWTLAENVRFVESQPAVIEAPKHPADALNPVKQKTKRSLLAKLAGR